MKNLKTLFAVVAMTFCSFSGWAASVNDLVAISNDWVFIADNITNNGTTKLVANTLYAGNQIFAPTSNTVAANKGQSTFGGGQHLNSLRLKIDQDRLAFKVAGACTVTFYTYSHSERGILISTEDSNTDEAKAIAKQPASTPVWAVELPAAGTYYLTSYNNDFYFAGFEVIFDKAGQPTISTHPVSASYDLDATAVALTVEATGANEGALSYQWYKNSLENFVDAEAIEGATEASYIPSTAAVGTTYYFCKVTEAGNEKVATSRLCAIEVLEPGFIVTFSLGESDAEGTLPAAARCTSLTIPTNRTLYKAGNTLTGWNDGADTYAIGAEYTPTADATLTPVFTENTFNVLTATSDITVHWEFQTKNGAPAVGWEGANAGTGFLVAQAILGDNKVDVKLDVDATSGKFNNKSSVDWCQINSGTLLTFPSKKAATVVLYVYKDPTDNTLGGNAGTYDNHVATYTVGDTAGTSVLTFGAAGQFYRYLEVTYPATQTTSVEKTSEQVSNTKVLRNGQLLIIRDGKIYNAMGVQVK